MFWSTINIPNEPVALELILPEAVISPCTWRPVGPAEFPIRLSAWIALALTVLEAVIDVVVTSPSIVSKELPTVPVPIAILLAPESTKNACVSLSDSIRKSADGWPASLTTTPLENIEKILEKDIILHLELLFLEK